MCWGPEGGRCLKALVYLQDRTSLKVLPGSHLRPVPLSDDVACIPDDKQDVLLVDVRVGDVVLTDIRLVHRGATEEETLASGVDQEPKILLSTVFGALGAPLTSAMQLGNAHRMVDWDASHLVHTAGPERRPLRVV